MIPNSIKKEFYGFLTAVDRYVSSQIARFNAFDEDGLTNTLLQCLDDDINQIPDGLRPRRVEFDSKIADINKSEDFETPFQLTFTHERFTKVFEGAVTQSDFLLQLDYVDPIATENSWTAIYLFQAKLPPSGYPNEQNLDEKIKYDHDQQNRIKQLRDKIGQTALKYCFYCRSGVLSLDLTGQIIARLRQRFGDVKDEIQSNRAAGIWLTRASHPTVRGIIGNAEDGSFCLARFIVAHYDDRENGENIELEIARYPIDSNDPNYLFLRDLCARKENALEEVWQLIGGRRVSSKKYILRHLRVIVQGPAPQPVPIVTSGP